MILGASAPLGHALTTAFLQRGDEVFGVIRRAEHAAALQTLGAQVVPADTSLDPRALVASLAASFAGAGALVLAAGTGDAQAAGAARLFTAAGQQAGVKRHVMVSNWHGAAGRPDLEEHAYVQAKVAAEEDLQSRDLQWTIVRTPRLTDAAATGLFRLQPAVADVAPPGEIGRADVAAAVVAVLADPGETGRVLTVTAP